MTTLLSRSRILAILAVGTLLGGCDTLTDRVRATREVPVVTHEFEGSAASVMAAAPAALSRMGFSITSISNARGEIEAITDIRRDVGLRNSLQTRLKFTVEDRDGGYSLAGLQAWDIHEEENARGERLMSEVGVSGPGFYNSVFSTIEEIMVEKTK